MLIDLAKYMVLYYKYHNIGGVYMEKSKKVYCAKRGGHIIKFIDNYMRNRVLCVRQFVGKIGL